MTYKDLDDFIEQLIKLNEEEGPSRPAQEIVISMGWEYQDACDKAIEEYFKKENEKL